MKRPHFISHSLALLALAIATPLTLQGGGGAKSITDFDEAAAYYTTDEGKEEIGKSVRLDVAYVAKNEMKTEFGAVNIEAFTYIQNVPAGSAYIIAGEGAQDLLDKYGEDKPDDKRVRTRTLRLTFLGLEGKKPVFSYD